MSIFAERLREYMSEHELNVSSLAKNINFSRATVSGLLNGAHTPSTEILIALIDYFNCSADYILGLVEYPRETEFNKVKPFSGILKKCLKDNGKSEYRLQQDLNISRSLTYRWLHDKAVPTIDSLVKLKNYFCCSVDYLLGRET
ncbi:MAG: helix-turn-helix transcriptional regulator [Clostridia bacterium]|nr:helix-turn-helix transcriptional regulator [Clostridia bacterium]